MFVITVINDGKEVRVSTPEGLVHTIAIGRGMKMPDPRSALKRSVARALFPKLSTRAAMRALFALMDEDGVGLQCPFRWHAGILSPPGEDRIPSGARCLLSAGHSGVHQYQTESGGVRRGDFVVDTDTAEACLKYGMKILERSTKGKK